MIFKIITGELLCFRFLRHLRRLIRDFNFDFSGRFLADHDLEYFFHPVIATCFLAGR